MHTDDSFLSAIEAEPADRVRRLVYADWLDDRHDPRAELVRVEEEMRTLPVFADRFWELKPRRNELRTLAGGDWCVRMRYGTECEPVFRHGIPDGWRDRWRLIREFTERWHRIPMPDVGGRQNEIAEAETRLKRELPPSLREWIAFAHDVRRNEQHHDVLRDGYFLEPLPDVSALALLEQSEGDYWWGVHDFDLTDDDPPVWGFHPDYGTSPPDGIVRSESDQDDSVSEFVLGYAVSYTRGTSGFTTNIINPAKLRGELEAAFGVGITFGGTALFEANNILVSTNATYDRHDLRVDTFLAREKVPAFLRNYAGGGGSFFGVFAPKQ